MVASARRSIEIRASWNILTKIGVVHNDWRMGSSRTGPGSPPATAPGERDGADGHLIQVVITGQVPVRGTVSVVARSEAEAEEIALRRAMAGEVLLEPQRPADAALLHVEAMDLVDEP